MPVVALVIAGLALVIEQFVQVKYGPLGFLAFLALSVGFKSRSPVVSGAGAFALVVLLVG
jgi:hypothetical protein